MQTKQQSFPFECFTPSLVAILSPKKLSAAHLSFFFLSQFLRFQRHNYKVISTPWDSTMKNWKACIDDSMTNGVLGIFPHIIFIDLICKVKSIIKRNGDRGKICSRGLLRLSDVTIVTWIFLKLFSWFCQVILDFLANSTTLSLCQSSHN